MLVGDDDVERSAVAGEFADIVEEELRAFNVDRLYGGEIKVDDLIDATATLPMMSPRRVVVVLEAEKLLIPKRESKAADEELERLAEFFADPPPHATTVFVCGVVDKRRTSFKKLIQVAQVVDCGTIGDASDAERWVRARASALKISLDAAAVRALLERTGLDLVRLRAGLERLALYGMGQAAISAEDVRQAVPAGPEMQENFGIANAISRNDPADALHELRLSLDAGAQPVMVLGPATGCSGEATWCAVADGDRRGVPDGPGAEVFWRGTPHAPRAAGRGIVRGPKAYAARLTSRFASRDL